MNYRKIYMAIISHALKEQSLGLRKKKTSVFYESHHILPKSLFPLWTKRKSNRVLLTLREHYFCHQLLTKIYPTKSMFAALWQMSIRGSKKVGKIKISSREYARAKENFLKNCHSPFTKEWLTQFNKSEKKRKQVSYFQKQRLADPLLYAKHVKATTTQTKQKVKCINNEKIFDSLEEARTWCGLKSTSHISDCCRGERKFAGKSPDTGEKLSWQYVGSSYRNTHYSNVSLKKKREQNNTNHISGKKILCINTGELFNSITLAAEWCNTSTSNISEYLSNSSLTFAGHHPITGEKLQWKYIF